MSRILISSLPSRCLSALMCLLRGTVTDSAVLWAPPCYPRDSISAVDIGPCAASWLWACQAVRLLIQQVGVCLRVQSPCSLKRKNDQRISALVQPHLMKNLTEDFPHNHWLPTLFRFCFLSTASYSIVLSNWNSLFFGTELRSYCGTEWRHSLTQ